MFVFAIKTQQLSLIASYNDQGAVITGYFVSKPYIMESIIKM